VDGFRARNEPVVSRSLSSSSLQSLDIQHAAQLAAHLRAHDRVVMRYVDRDGTREHVEWIVRETRLG